MMSMGSIPKLICTIISSRKQRKRQTLGTLKSNHALVAYFDSKCGYQLPLSPDEIFKLDKGEFTTPLLRYANLDDRRPCEHVVFHECLAENNPKFNIAVNPRLPSIWSFDDEE